MSQVDMDTSESPGELRGHISELPCSWDFEDFTHHVEKPQHEKLKFVLASQ